MNEITHLFIGAQNRNGSHQNSEKQWRNECEKNEEKREKRGEGEEEILGEIKQDKEQKRGGKGVIGSGLAEGDFTKQLISCSTLDHLMFFTSRGRVLWLKAHDIPEAEKISKGRALVNLLGLKDEKVTKVIPVENFEDSLFMATKNGIVKRISLSYFSKPR